MARKKKVAGQPVITDADSVNAELANQAASQLAGHLKALTESIAPLIQAAEEELAVAEKMMDERTRSIKLVRYSQMALRVLEHSDEYPRYALLLSAKKELESKLNARSHDDEGVNIYRTPDTAPIRQQLFTVAEALGKIERGVALYFAGVYGVNVDAAFQLVSSDDRAYQSRTTKK